MMFVNPLKKVITYFGSETKVAKVLGAQQQNVSDWYRGRSAVPLDIALHLDWLMRGEVHWQDFVSFEIVYRLKNLCLSLKEAGIYPCELTHILTSRIHVPERFKSTKIIEKVLKNTDRAPCIDENYTLVFGYETFCKYQNNNKRTIPCWKISLANLYEGNYVAEDLTKAFLISERVAMGIAFGGFIGNRQGQRNDLQENKSKGDFYQELVENFPQVGIKPGVKTRDFISNRLGFRNSKTYEQAIKVQQGCSELIKAVDQEKLSISKGARLAKLTHEEQQKALNRKNSSFLSKETSHETIKRIPR